MDAFAKNLDSLRLAYEQYFIGIVREEPLKLRDEVLGQVRRYTSTMPQNARLRFKLQQIVAKYNAYVVLWDRTLREMEEGRFKRDVFRMKLHEKEKQRQVAEKKPLEKASPPSVKDPMELLFQQFLTVKKQCNESTEGLSFENFKQSLVNQVQKMQPQLQGKKLKFQVAAEAGKAKIKTFVSK